MLRLEDTDLSRIDPKAERGVYLSLKWLGLKWDEGPVSHEKFSEEGRGSRGPYRQSERLAVYEEHLEKLKEMGRAYPCFCTAEEIEAERRAYNRKGLAYVYPGRCAKLDEKGARQCLERNPNPVWRFRAAPGTVEWKDEVRGTIKWEASRVGDFVIHRSSGIPTYNFAVVIDDHLMDISHVIRGDDHLSNTAKQIMLYDALGWDPPRFAHLPLITGPDKKPLAKRHGASSLDDLYRAGFTPEAIVNYLALLGWSSPSGKEILTIQELAREFSLDRINKSASVFDLKKLRWLSGKRLRAMSDEDLIEKARPYLEHEGLETDALAEKSLHRAIELVKPRISTLLDVAREMRPFLGRSVPYGKDARQTLAQPESARVIGEFTRRLADLEEFTEASIQKTVMETGKTLGLAGKNLFQPIRAAALGRASGPDLVPSLFLLGKTTLEKRLAEAPR